MIKNQNQQTFTTKSTKATKERKKDGRTKRKSEREMESRSDRMIMRCLLISPALLARNFFGEDEIIRFHRNPVQ